MARASKRDDVLDKAALLFERNGFVATGVNEITREAGVASMTLYNNFKDKDALIVATLERGAERFADQLERAQRDAGQDPRGRILAIFEYFAAWVSSEVGRGSGFAGCSFLKASIEFNDPTHPAHKVAAAHKQRIVRIFEECAREIPVSNPRELALALQILLDGAVSQAQVLADPNSGRRARHMASLLLDNWVGQTSVNDE